MSFFPFSYPILNRFNLSLIWFIFPPDLQGHLYIIDVSQSVDLDHPRAIEFLIEDCDHVSVSFFQT